MSTLTLEQALQLPAGSLAEQAATTLYDLKLDAAECVAAARDCADHIDRALSLKYNDAAHALRRQQGKDTGVVHLDDGDVRVTADLPKKIEWDQQQLAELVARIRAGGEDPAEFVEISYRVNETKYGAWPESLKASFAPARTLKTGKPGFRLALMTAATA